MTTTRTQRGFGGASAVLVLAGLLASSAEAPLLLTTALGLVTLVVGVRGLHHSAH